MFVFQLQKEQPEDLPLSLSFAFGFDFGQLFLFIPFKQAGNSGSLWSHLVPIWFPASLESELAHVFIWDSKVQIPSSALEQRAVVIAG